MFLDNIVNYRKILLIVFLFLVCTASSFYIGVNNQKGLETVFWICMLLGTGAYFLKNMVNPEKIFYLFMFTIPFMSMTTFSYKYILPLACCFLIFFVVLYHERQLLVKNLIATWSGRLLFLYVVINLIVFPYSMSIMTSAAYLISFPVIILLWDWVVQFFNDAHKIAKVVKAFNFIGTLYSILSIVIMGLNFLGVNFTGYLHPYYYRPVNRFIYEASSVFSNTNTFGVLLVFTIPCAFYLFIESRKKQDIIIYLLCFLLMCLNLLLTFSRSSWGTVFIGIAILLLYKFRKIRKLAVIFLIVAALSIPFIPNVHINLGKFSEGIFSLSSRGILWDAAYEAITDRPLTGFGVGNSISALSLYSNDILNRTPHNTFLRMWVEMGIFGLLVYAAFLVNIIIRFFKCRKKSTLMVMLFGVLMSTLFLQMFETMLLGGLSIIGAYFFIVSALFESTVICADRVVKNQDENMLSCKCCQ